MVPYKYEDFLRPFPETSHKSEFSNFEDLDCPLTLNEKKNINKTVTDLNKVFIMNLI
jgi:hypothetical protein